MEVKQLYNFVNETTKEILGETAVVNENLENIVDVGTQIFNANALDRYVEALVNRIGRVIFVNRPYRGRVPSVLREKWEYGSVVEKVRMKLPEAIESEEWSLSDGTSYDPNIFYQPKISVKFFNGKTAFTVPISITRLQVKQSFVNADELNSFISMIYTAMENAMTIKLDSLVMRVINNLIGETIYSEYGATALNTKSGVRAINLLKLYNDDHPEATLTADNALKSPEFLRFAAYQIGLISDRLTGMTTLFNIEGKETFSPKDRQTFVMLSEFARAMRVYLYDANGQFNNDNLTLPNADIVNFWQGSGTDYATSNTSRIDVTTSEGHIVNTSGILGAMFDRDALGVYNADRRTETEYNKPAEFYNTWYKSDAHYFNDFGENFVVFFMA